MIDALDELESLLPKLPSAVERQRLGNQLDLSAEKLRTGTQEAERLEALLQLASLLGVESSEQEELEEALDEAKRVANALIDAQDAEQLEQAVNCYEREFIPAVKALHRSLNSRWTMVCNRDFGPLVQVGMMLTKLDQNSDLGQRLTECGQAAKSYSPGASAPEFLRKVRGFQDERVRLQEQRIKTYGDGGIADFINALAENRAKLDMVTPEVRNWLDKQGAADWLRVTV